MIFNFCVACGVNAGDDILLHTHHLVPKLMGGGDEETNLLTLCHVCHGKLHGLNWRNNHKELQSIGIERAKKAGLYKGRARDTKKRASVRVLLLEGKTWDEVQHAVKCGRSMIATMSKELKEEK